MFLLQNVNIQVFVIFEEPNDIYPNKIKVFLNFKDLEKVKKQSKLRTCLPTMANFMKISLLG